MRSNHCHQFSLIHFGGHIPHRKLGQKSKRRWDQYGFIWMYMDGIYMGGFSRNSSWTRSSKLPGRFVSINVRVQIAWSDMTTKKIDNTIDYWCGNYQCLYCNAFPPKKVASQQRLYMYMLRASNNPSKKQYKYKITSCKMWLVNQWHMYIYMYISLNSIDHSFLRIWS